jgi:hypothetical protein
MTTKNHHSKRKEDLYKGSLTKCDEQMLECLALL